MHDPELDRFKRDIHFVHYAIERYGYTRDARESSRASHVLRREASDDKLIVRRSDDGHWTYFSVRDGRDNGTIVDFVQRRAAARSRLMCRCRGRRRRKWVQCPSSLRRTTSFVVENSRHCSTWLARTSRVAA